MSQSKYKASHICIACSVPVGLPACLPQVLSTSSRPMEWLYDFRAIFLGHPTSPHPQSQLSDILYRNPAECEFKILLGGEPINVRIKSAAAFYCLCASDAVCPHVYLIHAHCWDFVKHIVGPLAENQLDVLVTAIEENWLYFPEGRGVFQLEKCDPFHQFDRPFPESRQPYQHKEILTPLTDPLWPPTLKNVVYRSKMRRLGPRVSPQIPPKSRSAYLTNVPYDIRMLIFDEFTDPTDAVNATIAFCWQLPDSYWRSHYLIKMTPEVDGLPVNDLDWQYLFAELVRLSKVSRSLINRQRIFRLLEDIRSRFFELLEMKRFLDDEGFGLYKFSRLWNAAYEIIRTETGHTIRLIDR